MGRPSKVRPPKSVPTRRGFFKQSGAAAAAFGVLPILQACGGGSDGDSPPPAGIFQHGVASGDPLSDRVIIWTRVTPPSAGAVTVNYVLATDAGLLNIVQRGAVSTDQSVDHTVKVDVTQLSPATTYYYRFDASGSQSAIGRTKTLPVGAVDRLRMAVVSCASLAHGYFNAYGRIAARADLDVVVHLGDYIYEYGNGQYGSLRDYEPANEIITLSDYRARHAQYKREPELQAMHRQHPMIAIWDDHEFADNAYAGGALNHTEGVEGTWAARVAGALQAYYEWMPVRVMDAANLRKNNRSFAYGNLVDLIMLEERVNARSQQLPGNVAGSTTLFDESGAYLDPTREMLGTEEQAWLTGQLRTSTATWKLLGQGVMFSQFKSTAGSNASGGGVYVNSDQWDGYQPARDRVYAVLKGDTANPPIPNMVVLTGDIHSSWAGDLCQDPDNPDPLAGGYDPTTGQGSVAVEFVATAVTAPGTLDPTGSIAAGIKLVNPHFKYIDLDKRGYMLLDIDANRAVCEWWYVDTVTTTSTSEAFGQAWQVLTGSSRLTPGVQTSPKTVFAPPAA